MKYILIYQISYRLSMINEPGIEYALENINQERLRGHPIRSVWTCMGHVADSCQLSPDTYLRPDEHAWLRQPKRLIYTQLFHLLRSRTAAFRIPAHRVEEFFS